ncbi:MAG: MarR family winged helix-turn-helix transcriptional regulator [Solirubrobacteraceae bacterium]
MPDSGPAAGAPGLHGALVRHTGYLVSRCGVYAARQFAERLESIGLTPRMWGALNVIDAEGPVTQHQLGKAIGMDPSSMVGTIDELESRGLVERQPHPRDRRAHALHITAAGRRTLTRGGKLAAEAQDDLLAPLSPADRSQLHDLLLRIAQAASAAQPPAGPRAGDGEG